MSQGFVTQNLRKLGNSCSAFALCQSSRGTSALQSLWQNETEAIKRLLSFMQRRMSCVHFVDELRITWSRHSCGTVA